MFAGMLSGPVEQSDRMLRNSRMSFFENNDPDLKPVNQSLQGVIESSL